MKHSTLLALGLTVVLGVAGAVSTSLQAAPGRIPIRRPGTVVARAADRLALTDGQRAQIREILKSEKDTITALASELRTARKSLRTAIRADNATEDSVRLASAAVAVVESDIAVERAKVYQQISPILTQEQKDQIAEAEAKIDEFLTDAIARISDRLAE